MPDVCLMKSSVVPLSEKEEEEDERGKRSRGIRVSWMIRGMEEELQRRRCEDNSEALGNHVA